MNITKLASLTLLPISIALVSGCSIFKKKSAPATSPAPVAAPAEAPAVAPAKASKPPVLQDVAIRSTPAGATVFINGKELGVTPLMATQLDSAMIYNLSLMLQGYLVADVNLHAQSAASSGPSGKSGMASRSAASLPREVSVKLKADKDPYKALTAAVVDLDNQLKKGKISPAEYKDRTAELARFYGQSK